MEEIISIFYWIVGALIMIVGLVTNNSTLWAIGFLTMVVIYYGNK